MNESTQKRNSMIDDKSISKPPYSGSNNEPLPDAELSEEDILAMLGDLFLDIEEKE